MGIIDCKDEDDTVSNYRSCEKFNIKSGSSFRLVLYYFFHEDVSDIHSKLHRSVIPAQAGTQERKRKLYSRNHLLSFEIGLVMN